MNWIFHQAESTLNQIFKKILRLIRKTTVQQSSIVTCMLRFSKPWIANFIQNDQKSEINWKTFIFINNVAEYVFYFRR